MIRLDQIKLLESRVNRAVEQLRVLREENKALKRTVEKSQARLQELEGLVARFKSDQDEIEQGILRALKNLDRLEDEVATRGTRKEASQHPQPAASAAQAAPSPPPPAAHAAKAPAAAGPEPEPEPEEQGPEPEPEPVVDSAEEEDAEGSAGAQLDIF